VGPDHSACRDALLGARTWRWTMGEFYLLEEQATAHVPFGCFEGLSRGLSLF
jgi:hypothetical protein